MATVASDALAQTREQEMTNDSSGDAEARYVRVQDLEYRPVAGCARTFAKVLMTSARLTLRQLSIRGPGIAEDDGVRATPRALYVLEGAAVLTDQRGDELGPGHLLVVPTGVHWGEQLCLRSQELVLLEVARAGLDAAPSHRSEAAVAVIRPENVPPYSPAGHAKTLNRCLFVDEYVEIIEGWIEAGGGAERHAHRDHEQLLYVISGAGVPLVIHYPRGVAHGTGGGVVHPLHLLVVYSPPLGESQNALA